MTDIPVLEVEGLTKRFGEHTAVDGVSLRLASGESLAVVGESGSGKTTTARMITGLESISSGTVTMGGRPLPGPRARTAERLAFARRIQMVFQDPYTSLDRHQRIGDGIAEVLARHAPLHGAELTRRRDELLDQVGLDRRQADSRPRHLSGGQRQRAAIARALAVEPELLVLDEAVAALDVSVQAQIVNLLAEIRGQRPISYLFITHDLGIVPHLCERVVVMREGRIVEAGPTAEVLTDPRDPYTRDLIDSVPRPGWKPRRRT
ncbi:ABC transporter ATP-binding protein [Streptacidiphilus jiangxiensis]|uniref:Oligopeptide/dipeptide transporter, C-terminal region n=1 Tax=Streptacidiphilus jiangxiensis TaxID=235985 RepID=A0A1H7HE95_STRJI|nr:ATP-binding cassette domain-containing protein [Streptacidiphilus jiangxiensis]SEK48619.1 Oligopeptide/dipeptide transporter, C-terminal region [Streptacidiphilus jiangxiensis]